MDLNNRPQALSTRGFNHTPLPRGSYKVGCIDVLQGVSKDKGVLFRIYYPSSINNDSNHIPLTPHRMSTWLPEPRHKYADGYANVKGKISQIIQMAFNNQDTTCILPVTFDAPVADGEFPIAIFSHGMGQCRTSNSSLCIELASHGILVAAVEHRDNTACRTFYLRAKQQRVKYRSFDHVDAVDGEEDGGGEGSTMVEVENDDDVEGSFDEINDVDDIDTCLSDIDDDEEIVWFERGRCVEMGIGGKDGLDGEEDEGDAGGQDVTDALPPRHHTETTLKREWINYKKVGSTARLLDIRARQVTRRIVECQRLLNCLDRINSGKPLYNHFPQHQQAMQNLVSKMDLTKVCAIGHDLGGSTATELLQSDPKIVLGVAIDPYTLVFDSPRYETSKPLLFLLNAKHTARKDISIITRQFAGSATMIRTLPKAKTTALTDIPFISRDPISMAKMESHLKVFDVGATIVLSFIVETSTLLPPSTHFRNYLKQNEKYFLKKFPSLSRFFSKAINI